MKVQSTTIIRIIVVIALFTETEEELNPWHAKAAVATYVGTKALEDGERRR